MSENLVIVAIPEEQDRVWKLSSEKIPHLTLLFLGEEETADTQQIMQFVEHATTLSEHGPFYLDVDRRGTLGEEDADVIFFSKRSWNLKWIKQFRGQLLQNDAVRTAYDNADQFGAPQEWTPHVTLGYPDTPAKKDENEHPLYSVAFDRIAVWAGNFEGPEFRLEWPERELDGDLAVAYSDAQKAAIMHYGVPGQRKGHGTPNRIDRKNGRDPKRLAIIEGRRRGKKEPIAVQQKMAAEVNKRVGAVNGKYKDDDFSNVDWGDPKSWNDRAKTYHSEVLAVTTAGHKAVIKDVYGSDPKGKQRAELSETGNQLVIREDKVEHAVDDDAVAIFKITRDTKGLITNVEPLEQEEAMSQTAEELGEEFVEHFGTKGMQWGKRKTPSVIAKPKNAMSKKQTAAVVTLGIGAYANKNVRDAANENQFRRSEYRKDKNWEKDFQQAKSFKYDDQKFTKDYNSKWKDDFSKEDFANPSPRYKKYIDGYMKEMNTSYTKQYAEHYGSSPSGKYEAYHVPGTDLVKLRRTDAAQHSIDDGVLVTFRIKLTDGRITGLEKVEEKATTAEHGAAFASGLMHGAAEAGEAFILEHYGIKGMRWGFRSKKPAPASVSPTAASRVPHGNRRKTKIDVEGGQNHPAHSDAIKVAEAKGKLKKSGPSALSNQELREVAQRVQLENQVTLLTSSKGKRYVQKQLEQESANLGKQAFRTGAKAGGKKVAKKVAVAAL